MSSQLVPWAGVGHKVMSDNIGDAIKKAHLDWGIEEYPLQTSTGLNVPNMKGLFRKDDNRFLSVVNSKYHVYSNEEMFDWFKPFMETGKLTIDSAGELNGGKKIWVLAQFKDGGVSVGRNDSIDKYILASNSCDAESSLRFSLTPIRPSCTNMFPGILRSSFIAIRHSSLLSSRVKDAQSVLDNATEQFNMVAAQFSYLAEREHTREKLDEYVRRCLKVDVVSKEEDLKARVVSSINNIKQLVVSSPGNTVEIAKTWWGAYNAMTYHYTHDYGRNVNNRLNNLWFGQNAQNTKRCLDVALEMAA